MEAVASKLREGGHEVSAYAAETVGFDDVNKCNVIFSMARDADLLTTLQNRQTEGTVVINSPKGIRLCNCRYDLDKLLRGNGVAVPPENGDEGVWIKRGDGSAEIKDDVVLCRTKDEIEHAIRRMQERGITSWIRQAHITGDLVKFYGVLGRFFSFSYPTDSGHSKFGLETANGKAQHYSFDAEMLRCEAEITARVTGVSVYGGDAVVTADGSFYLIDFNDWPTFSSCRDEAAKAIAELICEG